MKKILSLADRYLQESNWKTLAAIKFCLLSLGMMAGMMVPHGARRGAAAVCVTVFVCTCAPLMIRFFRMIRKKE